jgi:hypothetical protein
MFIVATQDFDSLFDAQVARFNGSVNTRSTGITSDELNCAINKASNLLTQNSKYTKLEIYKELKYSGDKILVASVYWDQDNCMVSVCTYPLRHAA